MNEPQPGSPEPPSVEVPDPPISVALEAPSAERSHSWARIGALAALTVALLAVGHYTGITEYLSRERIQAMMTELGALGFVLFVATFAIGELLHVPGMVFVFAAILAYGRLAGYPAAVAGAMVSVTVSFWVVRLVGGQPLGEITNPRLRSVLAHLEERPIRTVAILRTFLFLAPALNYALAMSSVRFRHYLIGSFLGLLGPLLLMTLLFDQLLSTGWFD